MSDTETEVQRVSPGNASALRRTAVYTVISISIYGRDVLQLDAAIERCKAAGLTRVSKSWIIRRALDRLDLTALIADELARPR